MENTIKFAEHMAAVEQDMKSVHRRLDTLESTYESIHALATSVAGVTIEIKAMRKDVNDLDNRLGEVESTPKKRYELIVTGIISAVVGAICGYILKALGLF